MRKFLLTLLGIVFFAALFYFMFLWDRYEDESAKDAIEKSVGK